MAIGVRNFAKTQVGVSSTGYAGPLGGTEQIPVGTVCFAISVNDSLFTKSVCFKTSRNLVREKATMLIYYYLYTVLKEIK